MKAGESMSSSVAGLSQVAAPSSVETDMTVQAFAQWLTEMKARSSRTLQEMLSEMSIIRDGITSNNVELTDFKRHSSGISQQMQSQLTDLREKLTNAFGEITTLVKQKTLSDQEMMQDINSLQGNLSCKTAEIENLKRSYSQAHQQLQSSLIQITNHMSVTKNEVSTATSSCERVQQDTSKRLGEIDTNLRGLEEMLSVGNAENRNQMLQLQDEIKRIHESLASVSAEFTDHKRATNSVHNKLQSQVWSLEEGRKRQQPFLQAETQAVAQAIAKAEASTLPTRTAEVLRTEALPAVTVPTGPVVVESQLAPSVPTTINTQPAPAYATQTVTQTITAGASATPPAAFPMTQPAGGSVQADSRATSGTLRPTTEMMSASVLPTQQMVVSGTGSQQQFAPMQQTTAYTPGVTTRPAMTAPMGVAAPSMGVAAPSMGVTQTSMYPQGGYRPATAVTTTSPQPRR